MVKRIRIKKISLRFVIWYTLIAVVIFGGILIIIAYNYNDYALEEKTNVSMQQLDILTATLDANVQSVFDVQSAVVNNPIIRSEMIKSGGLEENMGGIQKDNISSTLESYRNLSKGISSLYLFDQKGNLITQASDSIAKLNTPLFSELQDFIESKAFVSFLPPDKKEYLQFFGAYYGEDSYNYIGYIIIVIDKQRMLYNFKKQAEKYFDYTGIYEEGKPILQAGADLSLPQEDIQEDRDYAVVDGHKYKTFQLTSNAYPRWSILALSDEKVFFKETTTLVIMILVLFVVSILLISFISFYIAKRITNPLSDMNKSMKEVEKGRFPPALTSYTEDEIHDLIMGYNHMVSSIQELTAEILREQKEKRQYEVAMVKTKLDLLQNQINPHFIHNTLNTMYYMAISSGNQELGDTIRSFNSLLRASISIDTEYNSFMEEIGYVEAYIKIQEKRYTQMQLTFQLSVTEEAEAAMVPHLLLQPIVENSLFHGILPLEDKVGFVRVIAFVQDDFLHVYVVDNGVGISEDVLSDIREGHLPNPRGYNHIGLKNVKERLELMCRCDVHFYITSDEGEGTTIYFCIPYVK